MTSNPDPFNRGEEGDATESSPEEMHYWNNKYADLFCLSWSDVTAEV